MTNLFVTMVWLGGAFAFTRQAGMGKLNHGLWAVLWPWRLGEKIARWGGE